MEQNRLCLVARLEMCIISSGHRKFSWNPKESPIEIVCLDNQTLKEITFAIFCLHTYGLRTTERRQIYDIWGLTNGKRPSKFERVPYRWRTAESGHLEWRHSGRELVLRILQAYCSFESVDHLWEDRTLQRRSNKNDSINKFSRQKRSRRWCATLVSALNSGVERAAGRRFCLNLTITIVQILNRKKKRKIHDFPFPLARGLSERLVNATHWTFAIASRQTFDALTLDWFDAVPSLAGSARKGAL